MGKNFLEAGIFHSLRINPGVNLRGNRRENPLLQTGAGGRQKLGFGIEVKQLDHRPVKTLFAVKNPSPIGEAFGNQIRPAVFLGERLESSMRLNERSLELRPSGLEGWGQGQGNVVDARLYGVHGIT